MHIIGYWAHTINDIEYIYPQELNTCVDPSLRKKIVVYLQNGKEYTQYMGYSYCRFTCGVDWTKMGSGEATDGFWIWPDGLAHYVEKHHIILPDEFIASVLGAGHELSEIHSDDKLSFWRSWCNSQRKDETRTLLADIQKRCEQKTSLISNRIFNRQTADAGESDRNCSSLGCLNAALTDMMYCARHLDAAKDFSEVRFQTTLINHDYTHLFLDQLSGSPTEVKKKNILDNILEGLINDWFTVHFRVQQYGAKQKNEVIIAAGAARARARQIENGNRREPKEYKKKRGVLILTDRKLVCGDWVVELADIRAALLFRSDRLIFTKLILIVETIVDVDYQFELQYDPAWEQQSVLELLIFNHQVKHERKRGLFLRIYEIITWIILIGLFLYLLWAGLQNTFP